MLLFFWQTQRLTREINDLEKQAMAKHTQISNYQKYASALGGSSIMTLANIAGLPSELLPRASIFAQYSNQLSTMSAMQNLQQCKMFGQLPMMQDPNMQQQMEMSAFMRFKEQALRALKQQETQVLNEKEKEIQLELNQIEQQLAMKRKQLDAYKQQAKEGAERFAPNFA